MTSDFMIKQISIFVENKFGRLAKIIEVIGEAGIDISALSVADATEYGIIRMIVSDPELAVSKLKENGVIARSSKAIGVMMDDRPSGLSKILNILTENEIVIDYMYAFTGKIDGKAIMVVKTNDMDKTVEIFKQKNVEMLSE